MEKKKVAVVGANQGALTFSLFAAEAGYEVTVFEAKKAECVAYDWADDLIAAVFTELGLERPDAPAKKAEGATLITPDKKSSITLSVPDKEVDIPVKRRELNGMLAKRALAAGVNIRYETEVSGVIVEGDTVKGVRLANEGDFLASLTVDCGGADSAVRSSLPDCLHIPQKVSPDETFFVRRTFFERPEGTKTPEKAKKIYLKHLNERGISWCVLPPDGKTADVLVGRLDRLTDETFKNALADLKAENEIIGERAIKGGELLRIPVRHPISRMAANGYAVLGDSAYMTIPLIGSGMANGMRAARILADVISGQGENDFTAGNLYRYQLRYMTEIGKEHAVLDLLKNWFLNGRDGDVNYLLGSGIITDEMLQTTTGETASLGAGDVIKAGLKVMRHPALLARLLKLIISMAKQAKTVDSIPTEYDDRALWEWQCRYEAAYR